MLRHVIALLVVLSPIAYSSQLEVAVIQYPEIKSAADFDTALTGSSLASLASTAKTTSKSPSLAGGAVLLFQRLPLLPRVSSTTHLSDYLADVEGSYQSGILRISISITEGIASGIRSFTKRIYSGSAPLKPGRIGVISLRQTSSKSRLVTRGNVTNGKSAATVVILAQIVE